jgi:hypothetical protein
MTTAPFGWGRILLSQADRDRAQECAERIMRNAVNIGLRDRFEQPSIHSHYIGNLGEMAFAAFLKREWRCREDYQQGALDVGRYEVRTTVMTDSAWYVKAKPNDHPDTRVASILIRAGRDEDGLPSREADAIVMGWMLVSEIRRLGKKQDPGKRGAPAHFIRDSKLLQTEAW